MITSASGYECVNVTGLSDFITGDILPVRDIRGDGSWRAKKYEDLLFLQEAYLERKAVCDESNYPVDRSAQPKSRILDRTAFDNAVYFYDSMILNSGGSSYATEFIDADKPTTFNSVDVTQTSIRDVLLSLGFGFTMDAAPNSGRMLSADDVRHAFWRTKKLKRSLFKMYTLGGMYDCTYTFTYKGGPNDGYSNTWTGGWTGQLYYTLPSNTIASNSTNLRVSFTPRTVSLPRWRARASTGRISKWLYLCEARHSYRDSSITPETRYKLYSFSAESGLPYSNMPYFISILASSVGFPYDPSPYETGNDGYTLSVVDAAYITEHAFPAEIDSLNWNWQPSTN